MPSSRVRCREARRASYLVVRACLPATWRCKSVHAVECVVACQQPGAVSLAPHCRFEQCLYRTNGCHVEDLPDAFLLPLFSLNQNDYGASEGDSSVGIRSVGELGHYGLLPCTWSSALMHDQAVRPAA